MRQLVIIFLCILTFALNAQDKKVLFLGNSYTAVNNLPLLLQDLAASAGYDLFVDKSAPGGCTLAHPDNGHLFNQNSLDKIASNNWDYVVLQEQSQFPVIEYFRDGYTFPGSAILDSIIHDNYQCSQTLYYMTWGRKIGGQQCADGYCSIDFVDYAHMQDSLASAYLWMANSQGTPVVPVGIAWRKSIVDNGDPVELFAGDGSHPSLAGSYLAACTFYAAIFHHSPVGLSFVAGLDQTTAEYLQNIADQTVFNHLETWNIDTTNVRADFAYYQQNDTVHFQNYSENANDYLWDFGDGITSINENPVHYYENSGAYEVSLVSTDGMCKRDTVINIIDITTMVDDYDKDELISIYPVKANNQLIINCAVYNLVLFGTDGKLIECDISYDNNKTKVNFREALSGVVICRFTTSSGKVIARKIVI